MQQCAISGRSVFSRRALTHSTPPHPPTRTDRDEPQQQEAWVDIDASNAGNPLACSEYAVLIFEHLKEAEVREE